MAKPNLTPLGTPVADLHPIGEAADVAALEALPVGSRVAGIYPSARERCDILEKNDDGTWDRETVAAPTIASAEFLVFPVPILRIGTEAAAALAEAGGLTPEYAAAIAKQATEEFGIDVTATLTAGDAEGWHRGDWMQTYSGRRFYPLSPRPEDVDPVDIAHSLSMLCRYNGHVDRFYSVAEHCVLMSHVMPTRELALEALLHDASESYCGDMVRPLKHTSEMAPYRLVEDYVMDAIAARFGLTVGSDGHHSKAPEVRDADTRILLTERTALMSQYRPSDRWNVDGMEPLAVVVQGWMPHVAETMWLQRFTELTAVPA